jgi:hypothetical protein
MRRYFIALPGFAFAMTACMTDSKVTSPSQPPDPSLAVDPAGSAGIERPERRGANSFFARSPADIWRYAAATDSVLSVGIKVPGQRRGIVNGRWLVSTQERLARLRALELGAGILSVSTDSTLPRLFVKAASPDVVRELRKLPFVDYVEPRRIPSELLQLHSFGGCNASYSGSAYAIDVTGDELPTTFVKTRVDRAWAYANGAGTLLGILDTGVNPANAQLMANFTSGWSAGRRPMTQISTVGPAAIGQCPHGTYMAAVAAAPRDGRGTQGIAWKADVLSVTVESGVLSIRGIDVSQGVIDATNLGAKVVAMALGVALNSSALNDALDRGLHQYDVLFIGAAGTSPSWIGWHDWFVVYPANHPSVMAVSAADFTGTRNADSHTGAQVQIVSYSPTTTASYDGVGHHEFSNSSSATAMVSGVAALVRSRYPLWSADSVRRRLRNTAGTACGPATTFGPIVNAEAAVGGLCVPHGRPIGSPTLTFDRRAYGDRRTSATQTYCTYPTGGNGPIEILWGNGSGANCRSVTFVRGNYTQRVSVQLRDTGVSLGPVTYFVDVQVVDLDTACPTCL